MNLIKSIEVLHKNQEQGPRITRQDFIRLDNDKIVRVDIWTQNGHVIKVSDPVEVDPSLFESDRNYVDRMFNQ